MFHHANPERVAVERRLEICLDGAAHPLEDHEIRVVHRSRQSLGHPSQIDHREVAPGRAHRDGSALNRLGERFVQLSHAGEEILELGGGDVVDARNFVRGEHDFASPPRELARDGQHPQHDIRARVVDEHDALSPRGRELSPGGSVRSPGLVQRVEIVHQPRPRPEPGPRGPKVSAAVLVQLRGRRRAEVEDVTRERALD
mmetsp:Transcript_2360/g.9573  ORF Transcript_2360/g.9573 Transcript_2360/m.9573 type:complete len:200 (-) Transcript_2360:507-1106(-)